MGAPVKGMQAAEEATAEALLGSLQSLAATERRKHATVLNYWLSIRKDRDLPPIRDLDPLEISDAGPFSVLLELIGGGEDAEIRHIGQSVKGGVDVTRMAEAPEDSLLGCIAKKLPIVAISRNVLAFEDEFAGTNCSVTLLPFSSNRTWVDYVYGFVSIEAASKKVAKDEPAPEPKLTAEPEPIEEVAEEPLVEQPEPEPESAEIAQPELVAEPEPEPVAEPEPEPVAPPAEKRPGFSKIFDALAGVGFYGTNHKMDPALPAELDEQLEPAYEPEPVAEIEPEPEPVAEIEPEPEPIVEEISEPEVLAMPEPEPEPEPVIVDEPQAQPVAEDKPKHSRNAVEGPLQNKLTEVRAKADEARAAKLRANAALYDGLSAAYDFALEAEEHAEEYLKLVEAQGLKIQLRSPMAPVVKLAFNGMCDDATIGQLEAVLAWALKNDLPRGSLAERIESEGGIGPILNGQAKAA